MIESQDMTVIFDHVKMVRERPHIYAARKPLLPWLVIRLVRDIILLGAESVHVQIVDDWGFVASSLDWLLETNDKISFDTFNYVRPFFAAGQDEFRSEILLHAYASTLFTQGPDGRRWFVGAEDDSVLPAEITNSMTSGDFKRALVFQLS